MPLDLRISQPQSPRPYAAGGQLPRPCATRGRGWPGAIGSWLLCAVLMLAVHAPGVARAEPAARLTVTGVGQVSLPPDMATLEVGVVTRDGTAAGALALNRVRMADVVARLQSLGIEARDIQTSGLGVGPEYATGQGRTDAEGRPWIVGYVARNSVTIAVRDLGVVGGLIDRMATDDAANLVGGLAFGLNDPGPGNDEARRRAVADARARAGVIAEAAGLKLGSIREIGEAGRGFPAPMMMARMSSADVATPVAAGEITLTAEVTIVWDLLAP